MFLAGIEAGMGFVHLEGVFFFFGKCLVQGVVLGLVKFE